MLNVKSGQLGTVANGIRQMLQMIVSKVESRQINKATNCVRKSFNLVFSQAQLLQFLKEVGGKK